MRKNIYLMLLVVSVFALTGCKEDEVVKQAAPRENANSLIDKYVESESETEDDANGETIDYEKLDEELINQIISQGGTVTDGSDIQSGNTSDDTSDVASSDGLKSIGNVYYSTEGLRYYQTIDGMEGYIGIDEVLSIGIYTFVDNSRTFSGTAIKSTYDNSFKSTFGNYLSKSTYTNANGIDFTWYKYSEVNDYNTNVLIDLFLYSDGKDTIYVEAGSNVITGRSQLIYDFVDSIKFK